MHKKPVSSKFNAAIFDMDGVITNTMGYHYRAWVQTLKTAGITIDRNEVYCREGQAGLTTVKELFQERGLTYNEAVVKKILAQKEALFKKIVKVRFIAGSRSFLRYLHHKGIRLALVTGTSRHEAERILPKSLISLFEVTITGDEVRHGKPHPEPFSTALRRLRIKAGDALVIENAPFGITSAKRTGIFCVALETSLPRRFLKDADRVYSSFRELRKSCLL